MIERLAVLPFVLALMLSLAVTSITIRVYRALGWIDKSTRQDHPKNIHPEPVPRGGGIPVFISVLFATLVVNVELNQQLVGLFVGGSILLILGILDDRYNLSPYLRLGLGTVAAAIAVLSGTVIEYVSNPSGVGTVELFPILGMVVSILWIVWAMNFVNMGAKGLDGQLPGVVVVAATVMGILSWRFVGDEQAWANTIICFAVAGAYLGLLAFNAFPQKIMPGWGGGSLAGYFLATLAIFSGAKVATAIIVLGVPLMDVIYAIGRRLWAGKSPVWGDNQHLHHKLLELGLSKSQVAILYWTVTAILGAVALQIDARAKIYTIVMLAVAVGGLLLWINLFLSQKQRE